MRFTDNRKIDPESGQVRTPQSKSEQWQSETSEEELRVAGFHDAEPSAGVEAGVGEAGADQPDPLQAELLERTADLQRVSAEYANYRRRVERDRQSVIDGAKASVLTALLGVLDDLERARSHGDLEGPFKAVAEKLSAALSGQGLTTFGAEGDAFEPALHEAVSHEGSGGEPVLSMVMRQGYRLGERVLRSAMVAVTEDAGTTASSASEDAGQPSAAASEEAPE